jgi:hypothetical protein
VSASVELSWDELQRAASHGVHRYLTAVERGLVDNVRVTDRNNLTAHVVGAWGECAAAKALGAWWPRDNLNPDGGKPDVGPFHVRSTTRGGGRLIVYRADADAEPFLLVTMRLPRFRLVGWCYGCEAKSEEWWAQREGFRPAFYVPQHVLRPLDEWNARA